MSSSPLGSSYKGWALLFAAASLVLVITNLLLLNQQYGTIDPMTTGSVADWVGGVGTIAAVVWAVRVGRRDDQVRASEKLDAHDVAAARIRAALQCCIEVTTIVSHHDLATPDDRAAIDAWHDEMYGRGWKYNSGLWHRDGATARGTDELVAEHPAKLDGPWIVVSRVDNQGSEPVEVALVRTRFESPLAIAPCAGATHVRVSVDDRRFHDRDSAEAQARTMRLIALLPTSTGTTVDIPVVYRAAASSGHETESRP